MSANRIMAALLGCFMTLLPSQAREVEDYTFTHLGIEDGVAGPHIFSICQTPDGVVWWSTKNTVDRYNGSAVRNYSLDADAPYNRFAGRTIGLALSCDGKKNLYAFDNKGRIFRYNPLADAFQVEADVEQLLDGRQVILNHIYVDEQGIWVALDSGAFCIREGRLQPVLDRRYTHYILPAGPEGLLLCTESGVFRLAGAQSRAEFFYPCNAETGFYDPGTGRIWLGTFSVGVTVLEKEGAGVKAISVRNLPANPVRSIVPLDGETMLLGVDGFGVYAAASRKAQPKAFLQIDANDGTHGVLHGNGVYALLPDSWGNIFIGTYSGGIDIARPTGGIARVWRYNREQTGSLRNNHINCAAYVPGWGAVLGTDDGVGIRQGEKWQYGALGEVVLDVCEDGGSLLLATFGKGVCRLDRSGRAWPLYSVQGGQLQDDHVYAFCRSRDGHLWMGSLAGDLAERTPHGFRYYPVCNVQDIIQLPDGRMAVGTADGIRLVTPGSPAVEELSYGREDEDVNRYVLALSVEENTLWIATDGGGIYLLDLDSRACRQLTRVNGLAGNNVCSMVKDPSGTHWIGTENGLCRITPGGEVMPVNHIWALNREYTRGAGVLLPDGNILFGSTDGAVLLNPSKIEDVTYEAPLHLIGARFKARSPREQAERMQRLLSGEGLKLRFRENTFELLLESVNLRFQQDVAYQYQMDDGEWSGLSGQGHFRFAEVESGSHTVRVRSVSRGTRAVLDEKAIAVRVAQPLWNTWWMWMLYVLLVTGAFIGAWEVYQLHLRYMRLVLSNPTLQTVEPADEPAAAPSDGSNRQFVDKVTRIVVEHLPDPEFNIDRLCREMGMSRTYLYVRLKTFTGDSPQDFIRIIRLEKAAVLLRSGEAVAQVSDAVGFDNPKYFSTVFKKYFGVSPSKYR